MASLNPLRATFVCDGAIALASANGAVVHHVSSRAIRVAVPEGLITVAHSELGSIPRGIGVATSRNFRSYGLHPGDTIRGDGTRLVFSGGLAVDAGHADHLSTELAMARRREPGAAPLAAVTALVDTLPATRGLLAAAQSPSDRSSRFGLARAQRHLPKVVAALVAGDGEAAARASLPLIGLGEGLTPSGDDLLVGMAAPLHAWGWPAVRAFTAACADAARGRTTPVSADLLAQAADGRFAGALHALIRALDDDHPRSTVEACEALLRVGASSGGDLLAGVLTATRMLSRRHLLENDAS